MADLGRKADYCPSDLQTETLLYTPHRQVLDVAKALQDNQEPKSPKEITKSIQRK
ncbi:hypothetical protein HDIA_1955 [Hartmannibacter diazotrophicus]|uniref:Uncharacterized protein n=1 Tax=Hartmannibacter diazotrophicus TaxID=1482074 RepID=A0A2C9D5D2_9HYPH|nr:hypothetical protein HDIA_1955 [Hartmannibacter diazotrophicus]